MLHNRLLSSLKKIGATIKTVRHDQFSATLNDKNILWYTQTHYQKPEILEASLVYAPSPHTDMMTDCFCDTYFHTIKSATRYLQEGTL